MKSIKFLIFVLVISSLTKIQAQCNLVETIAICDINNIPGAPDGVINLYDEYNAVSGRPPISLATGTWFDPKGSFALDKTTGDLFLWNLRKSSRSETDYQFTLNTASCGSVPAITINLVLGAFSGIAKGLNLGGTNLEVCDIGSTPRNRCTKVEDIDLFEALESTVNPHRNGQWRYNGSSPNFIRLTGDNLSFLSVTVPYKKGGDLVDREVFEFTYSVPGMAVPPCNTPTLEETTVSVSVVRKVFSGYSQNKRICEKDILDGVYDTNINLNDDQYLLLEDYEGKWQRDDLLFNQITSERDSLINIRDIYNQIIDGGRNQRFGCAQADYTYLVRKRSGVCKDTMSTVSFKIYEAIRAFYAKPNLPAYCEDDVGQPTTINLYDRLEFTTEKGILYDYNRDAWTNWTHVSGPSDLGLISNTNLPTPPARYSHLGTISLLNAPPGNYAFKYSVYPGYNCPGDIFQVLDYASNYCNPIVNSALPCMPEERTVRFTIHPKLYAGENTSGAQFCETDPLITNPLGLELIDLLDDNGVENIYRGTRGRWVDVNTGNSVRNPFIVPQINDHQTFRFEYITTSINNCEDRARLTFTVFEEYQSGTGLPNRHVCDNNAPFDLFDDLPGNPNVNGTWEGPNGYASATHNAIFTPGISDQGDYIYTVPDNVDASGAVLCSGNSATIKVRKHKSPSAGTGGAYDVCRSDIEIDLADYLGVSPDSRGVFRDLDTMDLLPDSLLDVSQLTEGTYNFQYEIQGHASCFLETAQISIRVIEVPIPTAKDQIFCANVGATVLDLVASNGMSFNWYDNIDDTTSLSIGTILINGEDYFVAAVDSEGCESPRIGITVELLPLNHKDCNSCFKDGISANGDGENDEFDLCGLPVVFPNFELNIYNRFGTTVYKGDKNTPRFKGISNVSLTIGKELPSGVYFYVFDPKSGSTDPIQGNFYLSR